MHALPRSRTLVRPWMLVVSAAALFGFALVKLYDFSRCDPLESHCYHGYESEFSFDAGVRQHKDWMSHIPDDVFLSSLSMPGTHDTMTYDLTRNDGLQCQNRNLSAQLESGMRYVDARTRLHDDVLGIYHSFQYTGYTFADVMNTIFDFLSEHPTETIVVRLKEEGPALGHCTKSFEAAVLQALTADGATAQGFAQHLYISPDKFATLPKLRDVRGKVLLLEEFPAEGGPYGVRWNNTLMDLQDMWVIPSPTELWRKWDAIRAAFERAASQPDDNSLLYLSHLSASVGVLPIVAAAGISSPSIIGMNDRSGRLLQARAKTARTGIVIIDFPGQDLIDQVIRQNQHLATAEL